MAAFARAPMGVAASHAAMAVAVARGATVAAGATRAAVTAATAVAVVAAAAAAELDESREQRPDRQHAVAHRAPQRIFAITLSAKRRSPSRLSARLRCEPPKKSHGAVSTCVTPASSARR